MSRFLSALKRLPDNALLQDVCALIVIGAFIAAVSYGAAGMSSFVIVWRLGQ